MKTVLTTIVIYYIQFKISLLWNNHITACKCDCECSHAMTWTHNDNDDDSDNDNDNILFDHNIQIEIIMYNSLENQIIDWSGDYY